MVTWLSGSLAGNSEGGGKEECHPYLSYTVAGRSRLSKTHFPDRNWLYDNL